MEDKYKILSILEIENGWLLRVDYPANPFQNKGESYSSQYCKDVEALVKLIAIECKNK